MTGSESRHTVLIVDDMPVNTRLLASILRSDYHVQEVHLGADALRVARSDDPPDIILLDVMMPGMDGHEVCHLLKANSETADIPVIFVTARGESDDEALGLSLGAVDYISKPFSAAVVKARVRTHLQLKVRTDMLERLSVVDQLTGIANRRAFDRGLEREWERALRHAHPLGLVMVDIDHFKAYNDTHGHATGDTCLRDVAQALATAARRSVDLVARYGGEEFAILLPEADSGEVAAVAERAHEAVNSLAIPHADSPTAAHVTVSTGRAVRIPQWGKAPRDLVVAADQALYQAKASGRNRGCTARD